jgi:arylsulfatase A-like enzyme
MKTTLTLLVTLLLAPLAALQAAEKTKPNIVIILADDLGYGDLSCQGQRFFKTPSIDRMATEGVRFTQHYSGSAVCAPSRCSLMTGRDTGHSSIRGNGPNDLKPDPEDITIATLLRNAGYATAMIGKSCVTGNTQNAAVPNQKGFDHFLGTTDHRDAHMRFPPFVYKNGKTIPLPENHGKTGDTYDLDLYTREALDFLDRQTPAKPFFLLMSCPVPHMQVSAPADCVERARQEIGDAVLPFVKTPANREAAIQYAAMVIRLDDATASILAKLKEKDLDQNTVVILTSDNGSHSEGGYDHRFLASNAPLRGAKRALYEGGIRVPFIVRWPLRIPPNQLSPHVSAFWDFLPTACDLAGIDAPSGLQGLSYAPVLTGTGTQPTHESLYWEYQGRALLQHPWKVVKNDRAQEDSYELYNLTDDLSETKDIAAEHPDIVAKMSAKLDEIWKEGKKKKETPEIK